VRPPLRPEDGADNYTDDQPRGHASRSPGARQDDEAERFKVAVAPEHLVNARGSGACSTRRTSERQLDVAVLLENSPGFGFGFLVNPGDPEPACRHRISEHLAEAERTQAYITLLMLYTPHTSRVAPGTAQELDR